MESTCLAKLNEEDIDSKMTQSDYIKTIEYPCILESEDNIVAFVEEGAGVLLHSKDGCITLNTSLVCWDMYQFRKISKG